MTRAVAIVSLLVVTSYACGAPDGITQIGDAVFRMPAGWERGEQDGIPVLVPPNVPAGKTALLAVFPREPLEGDLSAWFNAKWAAVKGDSTVVEGGEAQTGTLPGGWELNYTAAGLRTAAQQNTAVFFFVVRVSDQAQPFLYLTDDPGLLTKHMGAIQAFLGSLAFNGPTASGPGQEVEEPDGDTLSPSFTWGDMPAPRGTAGLSGVYHMQDLGSERSVISGNAVTTIKHTYWCFFPDGRCYYSLPAEGLDNFNYDYLKAMNQLFCCTYKLDGDNGVITWGKGSSTVGMRRAGKTLLIKSESDVYQPLDSCDGLKLEGTYRRYDWQDEYSPGEGITFSRDGTFADEGFLRGAVTMWWWARRGYVEATFRPGNGTYRLASNSLVMLYADGRKLRANFHLADDATRDDAKAFLINTWRYVRTR